MAQSKKKTNINRSPTNPTTTPPIPLKKRALLGKNRKRRLVLSLLCSLAMPLLLLSSVLEIFSTNKAQFDFALGDFLPYLLMICVGLAGLLFVAMFFWKRRVFDCVFASIFALSLAGFLQGTFLNIGINSLMGDGSGGVDMGWAIGNMLIWLAIIAGCIVAVFLVSRKVRDTAYTVVVIALVVMLGTQAVGMTTTLLTTDVTEPPMLPTDGGQYILTEADMFEISSKDNVFVFVVDRFDRNYAEYTMEQYPETFEMLDGFTYYEDNLSLHMRTWPACATLVTGVDVDFHKETAAEYFERAYSTSPFLNALKQNDYRIKLYVDEFYSYRDASVFDGLADNVFKTGAEYTINDPLTLTRRMLDMAFYRVSPVVLKPTFDIASSSFEGFVAYAVPADKYDLEDADLYAKLKEEGITVQKDDNNFMYILLGGCHPPYHIDENGNPRTEKWADNDQNASRALRGDFLIIKEYIDALKAAGAYEDATIIITGDHASPVGSEPNKWGDIRLPTESRLTALFVKRAGDVGTPLAKCETPVSQINFIPSIVASAGLKTDVDFGQTYWDDNLPNERYYYHALNDRTDKQVTMYKYRVTGDGRDFSNWEDVERDYIGALFE